MNEDHGVMNNGDVLPHCAIGDKQHDVTEVMN
jgi:hypothetical protein